MEDSTKSLSSFDGTTDSDKFLFSEQMRTERIRSSLCRMSIQQSLIADPRSRRSISPEKQNRRRSSRSASLDPIGRSHSQPPVRSTSPLSRRILAIEDQKNSSKPSIYENPKSKSGVVRLKIPAVLNDMKASSDKKENTSGNNIPVGNISQFLRKGRSVTKNVAHTGDTAFNFSYRDQQPLQRDNELEELSDLNDHSGKFDVRSRRRRHPGVSHEISASYVSIEDSWSNAARNDILSPISVASPSLSRSLRPQIFGDVDSSERLIFIDDDHLTSLSVQRPEIRDISLSFSGALGWSGLRDTVSFPLCLVDPDVDKHIFETSMSSRIGINYTPTALVPLHFRNWKASPASESADGNIMLFSGPRSLDGTVCDDRIPAFRLAALRSFATHDSNSKPKSEDLQTPRSTTFKLLHKETTETCSSTFLPLEIFDHEDDEKYAPFDWIEHVKNGVLGYSRYFVGEELWQWRPCRIFRYDRSVDAFYMEWEPLPPGDCDLGNGVILEEKDKVHHGKYVRRFNLRFADEDPVEFEKRLLRAALERERVEEVIRTELFMDREISDHCVPPMNQGQIHRILYRVGVDIPESSIRTLESFFLDMKKSYQLAIKKSILDYERMDPLYEQSISNLNLSVPSEREPVPYSQIIHIPGYSRRIFGEVFANIQSRLLLASPAPLWLLQYLKDEWEENYGSIRLVSLEYDRGSVELISEFLRQNDRHFQKQLVTLQDQFLSAASNMCLNILEKDFNFFIRSREEYDASLLRRAIRLLHLFMNQFFRGMVFDSLESFVSFLERFEKSIAGESSLLSGSLENPLPPASVRTPRSQISAYFGSSGIPSSSLPSTMLPTTRSDFTFHCWKEFRFTSSPVVFHLNLAIEENVLCLYPSMRSFEESMRHIFESIVFNMQNSLPTLERELLPLLTIEESHFPVVTPTEPEVEALRNRMETVLEHAVIGMEEFMEVYEGYLFLMTQDPYELVEKVREEATEASNSVPYQEDSLPAEYSGDNRSAFLEVYRNNVMHFRGLSSEIRSRTPSEVHFNMFIVDVERAKETLSTKSDILANSLLEDLCFQTSKEMQSVCGCFEDYHAAVQNRPTTPEELVQLRELIQENQKKMLLWNKRLELVEMNVSILSHFHFQLPDLEFTSFMTTQHWPDRTHNTLSALENLLTDDKKKFIEDLRQNQDLLHEDIDTLNFEVSDFVQKGELDEVMSNAEHVEKLKIRLDDAHQRCLKYRLHENLFNLPQTEYPHLDRLIRSFDPYYKLWTVSAQFLRSFPQWMEDSFEKLNGENIDNSVKEWLAELRRLHRVLRSVAEPLKAVQSVTHQVESFYTHVPLVRYLRNPGMQDRHWKLLEEKTGVRIKPDESESLTDLLDKGLEEHLADIKYISELATQEYRLERRLNDMRVEWRTVSFLVDIGVTGEKVIKDVEDVTDRLEDHIVKTQQMLASPYVKEFEKQTREWETRLVRVQEIIDSWMQVQRQWLYLAPIFDSPDIKEQLPSESARFEVVNKLWTRTVDDTARNPLVMAATSGQTMLDKFQHALLQLEMIQHGLHAYLEAKRHEFPRFFFLSDDELLYILAESKDPRRVQPHLKKCFENIDRLEFQDNNDITAMYSSERERVIFDESFNPRELDNRVERWLPEVERIMRSSLSRVMKDALDAYANNARERWILRWPGQIVLAVAQLIWTAEVEQAVRQKGGKGLKEYLNKLNKQMDRLISVVRSNVTSLHRITLGALVVQDVHARTVVQRMIEEGVSDPSDFEFQSQLRYYWEGDTLLVRMLNTTIEYGFEYLGNTQRLVITPLTDRAYRTLMSAFHLNLGGSPEGPAGTGKTETVKDLAKHVAKQCRVFNCSEGLDYRIMGRMFKGLAACGAWSCFDEFNRLELEVLSVIAEQILAIQQALAISADTVKIDINPVRLDVTCAIFTTMNPGYTGRAELPDNLKALFRPVAMMIPDYNLIAEISLFSDGFRDGNALARKLVATYRLCSEQLSLQHHYDYGMRAVKAVLNAAGNLKRKFPMEAEDTLMLRAIYEVNTPKFLKEDMDLFEGIVSDLFPDTYRFNPDYDLLEQAIHDVGLEMNLCMTEHLNPAPSSLMSRAFGSSVEIISRPVVSVNIPLPSEGVVVTDDFPSPRTGPYAEAKIRKKNGISPEQVSTSTAAEGTDEVSVSSSQPRGDGEVLPVRVRRRLIEQMASSDGGLNPILDSLPFDVEAEELSLEDAEDDVDGTMNYHSDLSQLVDYSVRPPANGFHKKVMQLYETMNVRHGVMLVGEPLSGKSSSYRLLARALNLVSERGLMDEKSVEFVSINPKAVTIDQLFGYVDKNTNEMRDGIIGKVFREFAAKSDAVRRWIVHDGPVDSLWIETLNTVLDDNKKLCLTSGQVIPMSASMTILFEVEDLHAASPATVSRCGMVYLDPKELGWHVHIHRWLSSRTAYFKPFMDDLKILFFWLIPKALEIVHENPPILNVSDMWLVSNLCRLLNVELESFEQLSVDKLLARSTQQMIIQNAFIFSLIWSIGASLDHTGRQRFSDMLRKEMEYSRMAPEMGEQQYVPVAERLEKVVMDIEKNRAKRNRKKTLRKARKPIKRRTSSRKKDPLQQNDSGDSTSSTSSSTSQPAQPRSKQGNDSKDSVSKSSSAGTKETDGEENVESLLKIEPQRVRFYHMFPEEGLVFDFFFSSESGRYVSWFFTQEEFTVPSGAQFHQIIVPTIDTIRCTYLLDICLRSQIPCLFAGPTGTGKTILIKDKIVRKLDQRYFSSFLMQFTGQTTANQTQMMIESKLTKRRSQVYGPEIGKQGILFIDDLNIPQPDEFGAQAPIELLRQIVDSGFFYDLRTLNPMRLEQVQLVAAQNTRNLTTLRLLRHFHLVYMTEPNVTTLRDIFSTIVQWFTRSFPVAVQTIVDQIVESTISVFQITLSEKLPTPKKAHYVFNVRDLSDVFRGMCSVSSVHISGKSNFIRLWYHECDRVFGDRMIESDHDWLHNLLFDRIKNDFGTDPHEIFSEGMPIYAYIESDEDAGQGTVLAYKEVDDFEMLTLSIEDSMLDYNKAGNGNEMQLVLFRDAVEHVCRLSRILYQPHGHVLCIGYGGSGRHSVVRLAARMASFEVFEIGMTLKYSVSEWREHLKHLLLQAGVQQKKTVFLFSDAQVKHEIFLEDISCLLNTGEVPGIFAPEDLEAVREDVQKSLKETSSSQNIDALNITFSVLYNYVVERCRENLHICFCMSPVGKMFRERIRNYPALVYCCTIDWFHPWSDEALRAVARNHLAVLPISNEELNRVIDVCMLMHREIEKLSLYFEEKENRTVYVTPSSYLNFLQSFLETYQLRNQKLRSKQKRYSSGLEKLFEAEKEILILKSQQEELEPQLVLKRAQVEQIMKELRARAAEVEVTRAHMKDEEDRAQIERDKAAVLRDECDREVRKALPTLQDAIRSVENLKNKHIAEVRVMQRPPAGVRLVLECICIMLEIGPEKVQKAPGVFEYDYWPAAQRLLAENFREKLKKYKFDEIKEETIESMRYYLAKPEMEPQNMMKTNVAAFGLRSWVSALEMYHRVSQEMAPLKAALGEAESVLAELQADLDVKSAELAAVMETIAKLERDREEAEEEKANYEYKLEQCNARMDRATKLISGLSGEKTRWSKSLDTITSELESVLGDTLLSAATISYFGSFSLSYRKQTIFRIRELFEQHSIPVMDDCTLVSVFQDPLEIQFWKLNHLPPDQYSIENSLIMKYSLCWPLLIDPQLQASRWLKSIKPELLTLKQSDPTLVRSLEQAVQYGSTVILENVEEEIDPVLMPLLRKQFVFDSGLKAVRIGENIVDYNDDFRLYITTRLPNPHFPPEISSQVTIVNFAITPDGLEDQLLSIVISSRDHELEEERNILVQQQVRNMEQQASLEDEILENLSNSGAEVMLLDNEVLIQKLYDSKQQAFTIEMQMRRAHDQQEVIRQRRDLYSPVARLASVIRFCLDDLGQVDPMYQFSLSWFKNSFEQSIERTTPEDEITKDVSAIKANFLLDIYHEVCRSLFEKDKHLFSFLMTIKIMLDQGTVHEDAWRYFLTGSLGLDEDVKDDHTLSNTETESESSSSMTAHGSKVEIAKQVSFHSQVNPARPWLPDKVWNDIHDLSRRVPSLASFPRDFTASLEEWKEWYSSQFPHRSPMPGRYGKVRRGYCLLHAKREYLDRRLRQAQEAERENERQRLLELESENPEEQSMDYDRTSSNLSTALHPSSSLSRSHSMIRRKTGASSSSRVGGPSGGHGSTPGSSSKARGNQLLSTESNVSRQSSSLTTPSSSAPSSILDNSVGASIHRRAPSSVMNEPLIEISKVESMKDCPGQEEYEYEDGSCISSYDHLLLIRLLRGDKIGEAILDFVEMQLGSAFTSPSGFDILKSWGKTAIHPEFPLLFILSPGSDPVQALVKFSDSLGMRRRLAAYSLGKGVEARAKSAVLEGMRNGNWVLLQNIHLVPSWLQELERITDEIEVSSQQIHPDFRLWLTSKPSPLVPLSVLQRSIKMTNEAPSGLRANLLRSFTSDPLNDLSFFDSLKSVSSAQQYMWQKMVFSLALFHTAVQERRKFASLGWNVPYEFNDSDFRISIRQLQILLTENRSDIPFRALKYLTAECNYGGRITDHHDRRTIITMLEDYFNPSVLEDGYVFCSVHETMIQQLPARFSLYDNYIEYIGKLPPQTHPEVVGLHENASITHGRQEMTQLISSLLRTEGHSSRVHVGNREVDSFVEEVADDILRRLPECFDISAVRRQYPVRYGESMNVVLVQELIRYNRLISLIQSTLSDVRQSISGLSVMTPETEDVYVSVYLGSLPMVWERESYPTTKNLGNYITDLIERLRFFDTWIREGPPANFWISGFFFTQSFLTGVRQNFARKKHMPIDEVVFSFRVIENVPDEPPSDGCYIHGLFLEGARWDRQRHCLNEQEPKVLSSPMPTILLRPISFNSVVSDNVYECPVYKTSLRCGELSTTGHSTNYVLTVSLPCPSDCPSSHWIKRGTALVCSTD